MINLLKFSNHGKRYLENAQVNWQVRLSKWINVWCNENNPIRKRRVFLLTMEIEDNISLIRGMRRDLHELEIERDRIYGETLIFLECPTHSCRWNLKVATGLAIKYKDYKDGTYFCQKCKKPMQLKEEPEMKMLFAQNKINY